MKCNHTIILLMFWLLPNSLFSQTNNIQLPTSFNEDGNVPDQSAILDVQSDQQGVLIPRMTYTQISQIANPAEGLMVYDTEFKCLRLFIGNTWDCLYQAKSDPKDIGDITGWTVLYSGELDPIESEMNSADDLVVLGHLEDGHGMYLSTFDKSGSLIWEEYTVGREGFALTTDQSNNIYIAGTINNTSGFLSKFDQDGNLIWDTMLGFNFEPQSLEIDQNGNIYLAGISLTSLTIANQAYNNYGSYDAYLVKMDGLGNIEWSSHFGGGGRDEIADIVIGSQNDIHIAGNFATDFYPPNASVPVTSSSGAYHLTFDSDGSHTFNYFSSAQDFQIHDILMNDLSELVWVANGTDEFTYGNQVVNIAGGSEEYLIVGLISNTSGVSIKGRSRTDFNFWRNSIRSLQLDQDNNMFIDVDPNSGSFVGDFDFNECPAEHVLLKYNYNFQGGSILNYEWAYPVKQVLRDFDRASTGEFFFTVQAYGSELIGNTLFNEENEPTIGIVKYLRQ